MNLIESSDERFGNSKLHCHRIHVPWCAFAIHALHNRERDTDSSRDELERPQKHGSHKVCILYMYTVKCIEVLGVRWERNLSVCNYGWVIRESGKTPKCVEKTDFTSSGNCSAVNPMHVIRVKALSRGGCTFCTAIDFTNHDLDALSGFDILLAGRFARLLHRFTYVIHAWTHLECIGNHPIAIL